METEHFKRLQFYPIHGCGSERHIAFHGTATFDVDSCFSTNVDVVKKKERRFPLVLNDVVFAPKKP